MDTKVSSATREIVIGYEHPIVLIGERINPTGKAKMAASLKSGNMDIIREEAIAQVKAGADILDVNVSVTGIDEVALLPQAVEIVMAAVDVPICIDSSNPDALIAALKVYRGKALVNSVSGDEHSMTRILPVVKQYGAAVIGMVQDEGGIPSDAEKRIQIAEKIVAGAEALGIPREDVIIDSLVMAVGAVPTAGITALETIKGIKDKLGVNQTIGASNISFGMPDRELINSAFLVAAITAGLTCPIVDAAKVRPIVLAIDLVLNRDSRARRYVKGYRERRAVV